MFEKIKANLFTLHGLITSMLHVLLIVGALSAWVLFQVQVMGNDVTIGCSTHASRNK